MKIFNTYTKQGALILMESKVAAIMIFDRTIKYIMLRGMQITELQYLFCYLIESTLEGP